VDPGYGRWDGRGVIVRGGGEERRRRRFNLPLLNDV
jgi:hypothetical protein